jgi:hypothetical protein
MEQGMARLIVLNRGGAAGKVAINADLVTDVRSAGAFTDVFCGGRQIAVDGSFEQVVALLNGGTPSVPARWDQEFRGQNN